MTDIAIQGWRGPIVEEHHRLHAVIVDREGRVLGASGDPHHRTFWRSAAKPLQALAAMRAGTWDRFGWGDRELALACASHSSEERHVSLAREMLASIGLDEDALACGPHRPLSDAVARALEEQGVTLTRAHSNCSGKHAAMLGLAIHRGWPTAGYEQSTHPVQSACLEEVVRQSGIAAGDVAIGVDGCTVACFGLPLSAMARVYANLVDPSHEGHATVEAMMRHPELVGGEGRLCTELMRAFPGRVVAKVGASGVYCAGIVGEGIGVALKVEDGHARAAEVALLFVLDTLLQPTPSSLLPDMAEPVIRNTRGDEVGLLRGTGSITQWSGTA